MAVSEGYKIRPSPKTDSKDSFRLFLSSTNFVLLKLSAGDVCNIETPAGLKKPVTVWPANERIQDNVAQISKALQKLYGLDLGCRVYLSRSNASIADACDIDLCEVSDLDSETSLASLDDKERFHWAWLLEYVLEKTEILAPCMILDRVQSKGNKRTFKILRINSSADAALYRAQKNCKVHIVSEGLEPEHVGKSEKLTLTIPEDGVGGLNNQIKQLNDIVAMYSESNDITTKMPAFFQPRQGGILLYGPRGTGKSTVLRKVAEANWKKVFYIDSTSVSLRVSESEAAITRVFSNALGAQPSVIIIDALDTVAGKRDPQNVGRSGIVGQILSRELERLENARTLAIGAARNLTDIPHGLRGAGYFELEIEIPVPDSTSRAEILKVLAGLPKEKTHPTLDSIASRTHGFVGADLKKLLGRAVKIKAVRDKISGLNDIKMTSNEVVTEKLLEDMQEDFDSALHKVRPTAMQEIFVETPDVRWSDIGGQRRVKEELEEAVVWPIKYPEALDRHGLKAKKGLLLYGPPGCSKTMTAKAAATESGLNFIAVRGPELMSMYVGESERAVREVFSKARAVSPSIIFFDEIDAIGATADNGQHGGVHTVTTLLNELDGFQELKGVFVLAATNKPDKLDPALIRAGRLDTTLYVGLPDIEARREILDMRMRNMYISEEIDTRALSEATEGFSGAEITSICQKASYAALREEMETKEQQRVSQKHFNAALTKAEKSVTANMIKKYEAWGVGRH